MFTLFIIAIFFVLSHWYKNAKPLHLFALITFSSSALIGQSAEVSLFLKEHKKDLIHKTTRKPSARSTSNSITLDSLVTAANSKEVYTYDASGNDLSYTNYFWDSNTWKPTHKVEFSHNQGKLATAILSDWDENSSQWILSYKEELEYNGEDLTTVEESEWNSTAEEWEYEGTRTYAYSSGLQISQTSTSSSGDISKVLYTYVSGKLASETFLRWNPSTPEWENLDRIEHEYDGNQRTTLTALLWNTSTEEWDLFLKIVNSFNSSNGNLENTIHYEWINSEWSAFIKIESQYDNSVVLADLTLPAKAEKEHFVHKLNAYVDYTWNESEDAWEIDNTTQLHYSSDVATGIESPQISPVSLFPNPVLSDCILEVTESGILSLYNSQGIIMMNKNISAGKNVLNMESLPSGLYSLYFDNQQNTVYQERLVKP